MALAIAGEQVLIPGGGSFTMTEDIRDAITTDAVCGTCFKGRTQAGKSLAPARGACSCKRNKKQYGTKPVKMYGNRKREK